MAKRGWSNFQVGVAIILGLVVFASVASAASIGSDVVKPGFNSDVAESDISNDLSNNSTSIVRSERSVGDITPVCYYSGYADSTSLCGCNEANANSDFCWSRSLNNPEYVNNIPYVFENFFYAWAVDCQRSNGYESCVRVVPRFFNILNDIGPVYYGHLEECQTTSELVTYPSICSDVSPVGESCFLHLESPPENACTPTIAPTTIAPTTAVSTTAVPTTIAPTTIAPTTIAPTTAVSTTAVSTTISTVGSPFCECPNNVDLFACVDPVSYYGNHREELINSGNLEGFARECDLKYSATACIREVPEFLPEYCPNEASQEYYASLQPCINVPDKNCATVISHFGDGTIYGDFLRQRCRYDKVLFPVPDGMSCARTLPTVLTPTVEYSCIPKPDHILPQDAVSSPDSFCGSRTSPDSIIPNVCRKFSLTSDKLGKGSFDVAFYRCAMFHGLIPCASIDPFYKKYARRARRPLSSANPFFSTGYRYAEQANNGTETEDIRELCADDARFSDTYFYSLDCGARSLDAPSPDLVAAFYPKVVYCELPACFKSDASPTSFCGCSEKHYNDDICLERAFSTNYYRDNVNSNSANNYLLAYDCEAKYGKEPCMAELDIFRRILKNGESHRYSHLEECVSSASLGSEENFARCKGLLNGEISGVANCFSTQCDHDSDVCIEV